MHHTARLLCHIIVLFVHDCLCSLCQVINLSLWCLCRPDNCQQVSNAICQKSASPPHTYSSLVLLYTPFYSLKWRMQSSDTCAGRKRAALHRPWWLIASSHSETRYDVPVYIPLKITSSRGVYGSLSNYMVYWVHTKGRNLGGTAGDRPTNF